RYDRKYIFYGLSGFVELNEYHTLGMFYLRSKDYINGNIFDEVDRMQTRAFRIKNNTIDSTTVDISSNDTLYEDIIDTLTKYNWISEYLDPSMDLVNLYDHFDLYKDHVLGLRYQFLNVKPSSSIPSRVDNVFLNLLFYNCTYNIEYNVAGTDSIYKIEEDKQIWIQLDADGNQIPFYSSITENKDYFSLNIGCLERFPLPGNNLLIRPPKGLGTRHFITGNMFFGSMNRKIAEYAYLYPLKYRACHFLRGYPYSFDPIDTVTQTSNLSVYAIDEFNIQYVDS
ncbi:unnamed protein product, partial [marine sediment metagenome]